MTKDAFLQLAGQLFDAMSGGGGTGDGRAPKWDTALPAGQGVVIYASECSLKELTYQQNKANKPPSDPKWAEANQKRAKALGYWISYRQAKPTECWTGDRNRRTVTAAPPSDRPEKHQREAMPSRLEESFADTGSLEPGYTSHADDIPF